MLLADTSAWVDFLRAAPSPQERRLREAITRREVVVIDPIFMEVMAGARREALARTQRLLESQQHRPLASRLDWLDAATIYRQLRARGVTIRSQIDALVAAVAIRLDLPVLHRDRGYDQIARHTSLRLVAD